MVVPRPRGSGGVSSSPHVAMRTWWAGDELPDGGEEGTAEGFLGHVMYVGAHGL
jgi:hypothetical protein